MYCAKAADESDFYNTCYNIKACPVGAYCVNSIKIPCDAGKYCNGVYTTTVGPNCDAGYFCPEGTNRKNIENCAPEESEIPESYYCPEGTTTRRTTIDTSHGILGTYSVDKDGQFGNSMNRVAELPCPLGKVCKKGIIYGDYQYSSSKCYNNKCKISFSKTSNEILDLSITDTILGTGPITPYTFQIIEVKKQEKCHVDVLFMFETSNLVVHDPHIIPSECTFFVLITQIKSDFIDLDPVKIYVTFSNTEHTIKKNAMSIAVTEGHACWINDDNNDYGGSIECTNTEYNKNVLSSTNGWIKVSAGKNHICALSFQNDIECWGEPKKQVFYGKNAHLPQVRMVNEKDYIDNGPYKFRDIFAVDDSSCALHLNGKIQCWANDVIIQNWNSHQYVRNKLYSNIEVSNNGICGVELNSNNLICLGTNALTGGVPSIEPYSLTMNGPNGCSLIVKEGVPNYGAYCWGNLYYSSGVSNMDYSNFRNNLRDVYQGKEWVCFQNNDDLSLQCIGYMKPYSNNGRVSYPFQNKYPVEFYINQYNSIMTDKNGIMDVIGPLSSSVDNAVLASKQVY